MENTKPTLVQDFIKAKSAKKLVIEQFKNNVLYGMRFKYSTPQFINGGWICWYYRDIEDDLMGIPKVNNG